MAKKGKKPNPNHRKVALWLLDRLDKPRLMKKIEAEAQELGFSAQELRRGAQLLPLVHRPRELHGPWLWSLPERDEQVRVSCHFSFTESRAEREGWLAFGASRPFFEAGLLSYAVRGRVQIRRPAGSEGNLLDAEEIERRTYRELAAQIQETKTEIQTLREEWEVLREDLAADLLRRSAILNP